MADAGADEGGSWLTPGPWSWLPDGSAPLPNGAVSLEEWPPLVVAWDGLATLLEDLSYLAFDVGLTGDSSQWKTRYMGSQFPSHLVFLLFADGGLSGELSVGASLLCGNMCLVGSHSPPH